jgi:low affinity Fe/Cu permease
MNNIFRKFAAIISHWSGSATVFFFAAVMVVAWALTGPLFNFSSEWQLFINTLTTITTFLMVFLIQNTQNRDSKAMQLKLDELIISTKGRDAFVDLEDMSDDELEELDREFREIHNQQSTSETMRKLHQKIELEHKRRSVVKAR